MSPFTGKVPLFFLVVVRIDTATASQFSLESMGRSFQAKSPLICLLIQSSNSSQRYEKFYHPPSSFSYQTFLTDSAPLRYRPWLNKILMITYHLLGLPGVYFNKFFPFPLVLKCGFMNTGPMNKIRDYADI